MSTGGTNGEANRTLNSRGSCYASPTWNTAQMSMCRACEPCASKGMSSCNCQAMEAGMVWSGDTALYPMQTTKQGGHRRSHSWVRATT